MKINLLDAENQRLRSNNPETSAQVDLEAEVERAKGDVATLMVDSAVEIGEETYVSLVMQNYNLQPVQLDGGVRLGKLAPIEVDAGEKRYVRDDSIKRLKSTTKHND